MNTNYPIQNLFIRGGAHDLRLRSNYQKSIESYSKIAGIANLALGKSYKVVDGSIVYYVNKQDLINALGIVDPIVTDAMIEREMRWLKILPTIRLERGQLEHFIAIPGAKEYFMAEGGTAETLRQFAVNFDSQLLKESPSEREELFRTLLSGMTPHLETLRPFLEQVRNLDDKENRFDLVQFFIEHAPEALAECDMDFGLDSEQKVTIAIQLLKHQLDHHLDEYKEHPIVLCFLLKRLLTESDLNSHLLEFIKQIEKKDWELAYSVVDFFRADQTGSILFELMNEKIEIEGNENALLHLLKTSHLTDAQKVTIAIQLLNHQLDHHLADYRALPFLLYMLLERLLRDVNLNSHFLEFIQQIMTKDWELADRVEDHFRENQKIASASLFSLSVGNHAVRDEHFSIALNLAEISPGALCRHINEFTLTEEHRYAIALKLAETAPQELCSNIEKFALSKEQLQAYAEKFIESAPNELCSNIEKFSLSNEQLQAYAEKFIESVPNEFCSNIEKFALSNEQRYAIALKLVEAKSDILCNNIDLFALSNEHRYAIALKLVESDPERLCWFIEKLASSEEQQYAIALKLVEANPGALCRNIKVFSNEHKFAVALKLAETAPYDLMRNIDKFVLGDDAHSYVFSKEQRYVLAIKMIKTIPSLTYLILIKMNLSKSNALVCGILRDIIMMNDEFLLDREMSFGKNEEIELLLQSLKENKIPDISWLSKYLNNKTKFVKQTVLNWFCKIEILCTLYKDLEVARQSPVMEQIVKCSTSKRYLMTKKFLELHLPHQAAALNMWRQLEKNTKNVVHAQIPSVLLAYFPPEIAPTCLSILEKIKSKSERIFLREGHNQALLIAALHQLSESSLSPELKKRILEGLFEVPQDQRSEVWRLATDHINLGGGNEITFPLSSDGLKGSLEAFFKKKFQIEVEGFYDKFVNTIGRWRNKEALMTWAGGLDKLNRNDRATAHRLLGDFMRYVLEGDFSVQRMALENPHLETIFKDRSDLKKAWVEQVSLTAEEMKVEESELRREEPVERVQRLFATQCLRDRHLGGPEQEQKFPHLTDYLKNPQDGAAWVQMVFSKMADLEAKAQKGLSMKARNQALATLKEEDDYRHLQIELAALELLLNEDPSLIKVKVNELIKLLPPNNEFRHNLSGLLHEQSQNTAEAIYTVRDSDDPNDFLLMGTEVANSCQRVDGDPEKNCCILGYALDAKHKLALVKNAEGLIVARSVLRLLIDSEGNPVLFQERVYVANPDPKLPELLRKIALKKAESLGVQLLVSPDDFGKEGSEPYEHSLLAGEKPVPFEYVDALDGRTSGTYEIQDARQVVE